MACSCNGCSRVITAERCVSNLFVHRYEMSEVAARAEPLTGSHLSGQTQTAQELASTGWLHDVVTPDRLDARAQEIAEQLSAEDPTTQPSIKKLLVDIAGRDEHEALDRELDAFAEHWMHNELGPCPATVLGHAETRSDGRWPLMRAQKESVANRYRGRTVALTGGPGAGRAMAERFAAEGAAVALADVNPAALSAAADEIARACSGVVLQHVVEITEPSQVNAWIANVEQSTGGVDVLINNAGVIRDNRIETISDADWDAVLGVSLSGAFYCSRAVFPGMRRRRCGRILLFSSMSWRGNFEQANYVAAKAGVVGLTRALALEGARDGITANAIAPGLIETPMLASMNDAARELLAGKVPMKRTGDPSDIAEAAAFLASEGAGFITGVVLDVDGGISIGSSIR